MDQTDIALLALLDARTALDECEFSEEERTSLMGAVQALFEIIHEHGVATDLIPAHWEVLKKYQATMPALRVFQTHLALTD